MTHAKQETAPAIRDQWRDWLVGQALPLWSEAGFDPSRVLYHERLDWQARPIRLDASRLMVQARQIATYCRAALDGVYAAGDQALDCLDRVERLYHRTDAQPGWVFSIDPDNRPASTKRDLYAHAFILFACGWAIRYANRPKDRALARCIADEIDLIFSADNGGYLDAIPDDGTRRSQNPHMHLLEAYLVVFEATGDSFYLDKARSLVDLARTHLIDTRSGLLLEFFAPDWSPLAPYGANQVQAGHLFEWSWLLRDFGRLAIDAENGAEWREQTAASLFEAGFTHGCDHQRRVVLDSMSDRHVVQEHSARIWAQTELLRLLYTPGLTPKTDDAGPYAAAFLRIFAPSQLGGGWVDHIDARSGALVDYMPASSLYHIYGAGREIISR
ncbi:AGE family epimerase/isomerase [Asaia bogorensis]|uniref:Mannose-6-phosphate isomerase n=1 Tax=Asaia bogorensis NBRC 16594 TaxID=1231624 RepID=A0AAN4R596_9PROT|nr:AGE family epimerase/isomerase [Asaia bogorensis]BAT20954.1 mannose-6-phosphate isomerase [Asaia bogorensis NBRC 16594]GBQ76634.1 mannose-6-phosphate isomerase [Asaia bogorensis NBRC 16594]GEL54650.1 mannose-6-phosphate isomerase [Asaia bogorensis NBRC 16594]